jgi:mannose-6-phosphate isomerase-like protein (cupin superfamily)
MYLNNVFFFMVASLSYAAPSNQPRSLLVDDTPTFVRPYIIPHLVGNVVSTDGTANRFPITAASSGGAFTLLSTNAAHSSVINVPLHAHKRGYENFFCSKGIIQLWLANGNDTQQVRVLEPGDMGASPPGVIHAFQTMRPDTELFGVTFPGGLE